MDQLTKSLLPIFQTNFLSITIFLESILKSPLENSLSIIALNIFSYLNFCRVDYPSLNFVLKNLTKNYEGNSKENSKKTSESEGDHNTEEWRLVILLDEMEKLWNENSETISPENYDEISLSRLYFLLGVIERVLKGWPQDSLKEKLIPLIFRWEKIFKIFIFNTRNLKTEEFSQRMK